MKKIVCLIAAILICSSLLAACSFKKANGNVSTGMPAEDKDEISISIQSPMTLSNNNMFPISGEHRYLRLKMVRGRYYEDWNPGALNGTLWEGYYVIELTDENGKAIAQTDLSRVYEEPLTFNSFFDILFEDYNNDGDLDFTIGQYASSNGRDYKLFTLRKDGRIEELRIKDYPTLFISNTTGYYSTKLVRIDEVTFKAEYYDNSKGKSFKNTFRWNGKEFINIERLEG